MKVDSIWITKCTFKIIKFVGGLSLWFIFIFWGFEATQKILSKPISSNVAFIKGDDNKGHFQLPAITICDDNVGDFVFDRLKKVGKCQLPDWRNNGLDEMIKRCVDWGADSSTTSTTTGTP